MGQAIESVLAQSFHDFELIISDDCSTDSSPEIIERYASQDPRVIWWRVPKRLGLFSNYNKCLERASGTYVKPFAQDDLWAPELLSKQVNLLDEHGEVALVAARRVCIDEHGDKLPVHPECVPDILGEQLVYPSELVIAACLNHHLDNLIGEPCAVMFRKSSQGSGFQTILKHAGDIEYWLRILKDGHFGMINEPLVFFRRHSGSATATNVPQLWSNTDVVNLAHLVSDDLSRMGISQEQFIKRNFIAAARYLPMLPTGKLDLTAISEDDEYGPSDVVALKKSLLWALSTINEFEKGSSQTRTKVQRGAIHSELAANEVKIVHEEKVLTQLLSSISWRVTRTLREVNKLFAEGKEPELDVEKIRTFASTIDRQRLYIRQLSRKRREILSSRSWHIARFLRKALCVDKFANSLDERLPITLHDESELTDVSQSAAAAADHNSDKSVDLTTFELTSNRRYDMVLALHEATLTGAPMLGLTLAKKFRERGFNSLVVLQQGGELYEEFSQCCDVLDLSGCEDQPAFLDYRLGLLTQAGLLRPQTTVFMNSAALHPLCSTFKRHDFQVITLVHEFLSAFPYSARANLLGNTDIGIFSCNATLNDALRSYAATCKTMMIPQGLLDPQFGSLSRTIGRVFLFKEYGINKDTFVVLSCGTTSQRKGIDIFTQTASHIFAGISEKPDIQFIWLGGGQPADYDSFWWAKRDVQKLGIDNLVHFVCARKDIEPFFVGADVFMLPSREDPLPCVLHLAQAAGLPVVAFEDSGGAEEVLAHGGGKCVPYGSISAMTGAILEYYLYRALGTAHGIIGRKIVASKYRLDDYVDSLLNLAIHGKPDVRSKNSRALQIGSQASLPGLGKKLMNPIMSS